jgi:hypothetical protein
MHGRAEYTNASPGSRARICSNEPSGSGTFFDRYLYVYVYAEKDDTRGERQIRVDIMRE